MSLFNSLPIIRVRQHELPLLRQLASLFTHPVGLVAMTANAAAAVSPGRDPPAAIWSSPAPTLRPALSLGR
ncbi:MAG UNVERIFIED_CONTAM: hypothetical protein LVR18_46345 [Planctomycetaceae bacterium]